MPKEDTIRKTAPVYYVIGDDPIVKLNECNKVVEELLGGQDKSLAFESFDLSDCDSDEMRTSIIDDAVTALLSPPFLTTLRVVLLRDIGSANKENIESLLRYFQNPCETSFLILLQGGGRILPTLSKAFKPISIQRGQQSEQITDLYARLTRENKFKFEPGVREAILKRVSQDNSKLESIFSRIVAAFGVGSDVSVNDISPFLGEAGTGPIYELANFICSGQTSQALEIVSRMMNTTSLTNVKPIHPLQIISLLANHFRKLATLDDKNINNKNDAHTALGGKGSPYGSQKSWEISKQLGTKKLLKAIIEIGNSDTAIKGETAIEGQIIIELLIIKLCKICEN